MNDITSSVEFYKENVENYVQLSDEPWVKYIEDPHLYEHIGNVLNKNILDFGCGNGKHLKVLSKQNPSSLTGVDNSEDQLIKAKELHKDNTIPTNFFVLDVSQKDAHNVFGDKKFELIYSAWVVVHMENLECVKNYLQSMYELLTDGGDIIIFQGDLEKSFVMNKYGFTIKLVDENEKWEDGALVKIGQDLIEFFDYYWKSETLIRLMEEIGFKDIKKHGYSKIHEKAEELSKLFIDNELGYFIVAKK
jgi:SAM-dependent methyltransferase